jgi:hypothetical protein
MPGAFGFAPAVAIARLMPPVLDVLRGHDGGEEPATILTGGTLALGDRLPLYAINPSIDHAIVPARCRYNVLTFRKSASPCHTNGWICRIRTSAVFLMNE